jgi:thiol-disulfide isomerase/thioredoxin
MRRRTALSLFLFLSLFGCICECQAAFAFASPRIVLSVPDSFALSAVRKEQTAVYDGAEFVSILSFLLQEESSSSTRSDRNPRRLPFQDLENTSLPPKRAGYLTFVCGTTLESDEDEVRRVVGVKQVEDEDPTVTNGCGVQVDEGVFLYADSVATIPKGITDADAISTAAAALCGVHCGMPILDDGNLGTTVILGGGDYACFTAKALSTLGATVNLITTRPMQLKDTPLNPLRDTSVIAMPPVSDDENELGFAEAIGTFHTCIDTLGDEAKLGMASSLQQGLDRFSGGETSGVAAKLRKFNQCNRYVSALTRSQRFVLEEGLLFARDQVTRYQEQVERKFDADDYLHMLPPENYGGTLQKLFDSKVIFPTDRNENGSHMGKKVFVRGCSFPDYAEIEIWPVDTQYGRVRYGFPGIDEITMEARLEEIMGTTKAQSNPTSKKEKNTNPFVMDINSLAELKEAVVNDEKDCVLFVSAPYCKVCRKVDPLYTRMARISTEETESGIVFAKASTGGTGGKQLTFTLEIDSVPTFVLFKKGQRYGEPLRVKLPSAELDLAIQYLEEDKEWDAELFQKDESEEKERTKLQ